MLIQLNNLPFDITQEEIDSLCQHTQLIKSIHVLKNERCAKAFAMVEIDCSRVAVNAICDVLNTKYIDGHHVMAYPSLYSD